MLFLDGFGLSFSIWLHSDFFNSLSPTGHKKALTKQSTSRGPLHPAAHSVWQQSLGLVPKQRPLHCGAHTILVTEKTHRGQAEQRSPVYASVGGGGGLHHSVSTYFFMQTLTDLTLVLIWPPAIISTRLVAWAWERDGERDRKSIQKRKDAVWRSLWGRTVRAETSLPILLDVNRSAVVSDDVLPEDPRAIAQVFVINHLHSSIQNLCEKEAHERSIQNHSDGLVCEYGKCFPFCNMLCPINLSDLRGLAAEDRWSHPWGNWRKLRAQSVVHTDCFLWWPVAVPKESPGRGSSRWGRNQSPLWLSEGRKKTLN